MNWSSSGHQLWCPPSNNGDNREAFKRQGQRPKSSLQAKCYKISERQIAVQTRPSSVPILIRISGFSFKFSATATNYIQIVLRFSKDLILIPMTGRAANLQQPPQKVSPTRRDSQSLPPPVESLESLCWAFDWFEGEYLWLKKDLRYSGRNSNLCWSICWRWRC